MFKVDDLLDMEWLQKQFRFQDPHDPKVHVDAVQRIIYRAMAQGDLASGSYVRDAVTKLFGIDTDLAAIVAVVAIGNALSAGVIEPDRVFIGDKALHCYKLVRNGAWLSADQIQRLTWAAR